MKYDEQGCSVGTGQLESMAMGSTTICFDGEDEEFLDALAVEFGGRERAIRHAIRLLGAEQRRKEALSAFLEAWHAEAGPLDEQAVATMAKRYGL